MLSLPTLTVYYNTYCPVCDYGINRQQNKLIALARSGVIVFEDIDLQSDALKHFGIDVDDIRRRLHALDSHGRLLIGADVAIAVWRLTPGEGWIAALFSNPIAILFTKFFYDRFADLLYVWNKRNQRW